MQTNIYVTALETRSQGAQACNPGILRNLDVIRATFLCSPTSASGTQFCPFNEYQYFRLGVYGRLRVLHMWVFHGSLAVVRFRDPYPIRYLLID
jgi:hypothetical protein